MRDGELMKVGTKIIFFAIVMVAVLALIASVVYVESFGVKSALSKTNESVNKVQETYNSTIQLANLRFTATKALSDLNLGAFSASTSTLNDQTKIFDSDIANGLSITTKLPPSTEASQITSDLRKLKNIGDIALVQTGILIKYQNSLNTNQNNLAKAQNNYTNAQSKMTLIMNFHQSICDTIESSFTTISASANNLYTLPATQAQIVQSQLASQVQKFPITQLSITDVEYLLNNLAILIGTSQAKESIASMELAVRNIRLSTSQDDINSQLTMIQTYMKTFKLDMSMGTLNPVGLVYGNLLLNMYYDLAGKFGDLVIELQNENFNVQSISTVVNGYNQQISSQRILISNLLTGSAKQYFDSINSNISTLFNNANSSVQDSILKVQDSSKFVSNLFNSLILIAVIIVIVSGIGIVIFGIFLILNFTVVLKKLEDAAGKISKGDLTVKLEKVKRRDEFGTLQNAFSDMIGSLREIISHVRQSAEDVNGGSQNLSAAIEENSATVEEVSANLDKMKNSTKSSVNELKEMVSRFTKLEESEKRTSQDAQSIKENSGNSMKMADKTKKEVELLVSGLSKTKESVLKGAKSVEDLKESYASISKFIETIETIAEQTNLLALNAAIEAARAGEAGKGFAVVASEIRNLAEESNKAAEEIRNEIKMLQDEVQKTASEIESGATSIADLSKGTNTVVEIVASMTETFGKIKQNVQNIADVIKSNEIEMAEVSADAQERSKIFEEMVETLDSVSESMSESGNAITNIANTAEELAATAQNLDESVKHFKTE